MGDRPVDRRGVLGAAAATAAGAGAGWLAGHTGRQEFYPATLAQGAELHQLAPGESIQAAFAAGYLHLSLSAGTFPVTAPIALPRRATLRGAGQSTRIVATTSMPALLQVGAAGPADGCDVSSLVLDCSGYAGVGLDVEITGTQDNYQDEPDPAVRLDNLWVYDSASHGIAYRGKDCRAVITSRVRVRRARGHGMSIEASDCIWIACEATTSSPQTASAGFYVNGTNNAFEACKAWYCRDYGWLVRGTRNRFVGCESQDTRSHGWLIEYDKNTLVGCVADTAAMYDVGGVPGDADGFHVISSGPSSLTGCMSFDRQPGGHAAQQRWGFNIPMALVSGDYGGSLVGPVGWGNAAGLVQVRSE